LTARLAIQVILVGLEPRFQLSEFRFRDGRLVMEHPFKHLETELAARNSIEMGCC
jgi:hypothetical protein